jgi:hypothetical protein
MNQIPDLLSSLISHHTSHTLDNMSAGCQHFTQYDRIRTPDPLSEGAFTEFPVKSLTIRHRGFSFTLSHEDAAKNSIKACFYIACFCPADLPGKCKDNRGDGQAGSSQHVETGRWERQTGR